jgi:putative thioredoxin
MVDVTDATFETAVLERSMTIPVVVDLWAEWCGPCKTLGPMIEAAVAARAGKIELAKIDVDNNPRTAQAFQVQSIPAVFAVYQGRPIDGFVGAVPQAEIDAFLDRVIAAAVPSEADLAVDAGDEDSLRAALAEDPGHEGAILALASLLISTDRPTEAIELLARLPEIPEVRHLLAEARLAEQAIDVKNQEVTPLLDELLGRVKADEDARQEFLDLLEAMGPTPLAGEYRKKLAAAIF